MGVPTSKGEGRKRKERRGPTYKWREERGSTSPGGWKGVKGGEKGWEENPPQSQAKGKGSPYSIAKCTVPELILVLGSQPAGDVSHKPGDRLPLRSAKPADTPATLKNQLSGLLPISPLGEQMQDGSDRTVCLRLLPDSVVAAIRTRALLRPSPAR